MKTTAHIFTVVLVWLSTGFELVAQGTTLPSAAMSIDSAGYEYISATNPTAATYSLTIVYTMKFANGERRQSRTTAILEPGQTANAFKCSLRPPKEEISDVKVIDARKM